MLPADGDGEELVATGVEELVSLSDGEELEEAGAGDRETVRHRKWRCALQEAEIPAEEVCAATAIGMVKPTTRAATTTIKARIASELNSPQSS